MRRNDVQLGKPAVLYKDTKANIEALTGLAEGSVAYATDTNEQGTFNGSTWDWDSGGDISGTGVVGQVAEFVTDTKTLQAAKLIAPSTHILTLTNAAAATLALNITSGKTLTLTAADNYTLTIPATGTAALLASGSTLKSSPIDGEFFLHTPTGRRVLLQYVNGAWYPLYSFGTMILYVDGTLGTDAVDKGYGTGANAWATLSYAWSQVPSIFFGNITINIASGTYSETLICKGKTAGGAYTITLSGAESSIETGTVTSGVQGTGATMGSVTDTAKSWTTNEHRGRFVKISTGAIRAIKSNTADTLIISGVFSTVPTGSYSIIEPATIVSGSTYSVDLRAYQEVTFSMMEFSGASSRTIEALFAPNANITFNRCTFRPPSGSRVMQLRNCSVRFDTCNMICDGNVDRFILSDGGSLVTLVRSNAYQITGTKSGTFLGLAGSSFNMDTFSNHIENFSIGIYSRANTAATCLTSPDWGYPYLINNGTAIMADTGGQVIGTSNNQYSGNTTNENAVAASYGYID